LIFLGSLGLLAQAVALTALPAGANPRGSNGQIAFGRYDPTLDDNITSDRGPAS
jgi:hypothetical protein